jgi:hypothetical protein
MTKPSTIKYELLRNFCTAILVFTLLGSCSKDNDEPVFALCLLTKSSSAGDTSHTSTNYFYDSNDRLVKIIVPSPPGTVWGTNITYGSNVITTTDVAGGTAYTKYYLTADTLAYASASYSQGSRTDTVSYFYDTDKHLVKAVRYNHVFGKDSTFLAYANNNLSLVKTYYTNGAIDQSSFEYGTTDAKAWYYQNIGPYLLFDQYLPWFGKPNQKLISSFSATYNGNPQPVSLTYNLNASGYVASFTTVYLGTRSQTNFEYTCR